MNGSLGYPICDADSIAPGWAHPFTLERPDMKELGEPLSILIVRDKKQNYFAYRNVCPHLQHAIYVKPAECLSIGGLVFACSWHQAKFNAQSGFCTGGPCEGTQLQSFPTAVVDGKVCVSGIELADWADASANRPADKTWPPANPNASLAPKASSVC